MRKGREILVVLLALTGVYLYALPSATVVYAVGVLLHLGAGALLTLLLLYGLAPHLSSPRDPTSARQSSGKKGAGLGWALLGAGAALGVALIYTGTLRPAWPLLYAHIALSAAGTMVLAAEWARGRGWAAPYGACLLVLAAVSGLSWYLREARWYQAYKIENPETAPATAPMGPSSPARRRPPTAN